MKKATRREPSIWLILLFLVAALVPASLFSASGDAEAEESRASQTVIEQTPS